MTTLNVSKENVMKKIALLFLTALFVKANFAQYKNDNLLYKTVYTTDLCKELNNSPGYLLLDVRTPGEYADTSSMGMNIGRFLDAINIEIANLGSRLSEINAYKNKPVFVYCSHSQRSRRASKMLADSGFTRVVNINGGMTGLRQLPVKNNECLYDKLVTKNSYGFLSAADLCNKLKKGTEDLFLLDVRNDSAFQLISTDQKINSFGFFKNSVHMPLGRLEASLNKIPEDKEIVIIDLFGGDAIKAAELLIRKKYQRVLILPEGIEGILNRDNDGLACLSPFYISNLPYKIINAQGLKKFIETNHDYLFLDARTKEEFTNTHKNYWQNTGHLVNAVNIPVADMENQWTTIESYKNKPVIIYLFTSGTGSHEAARSLVQKGFTNIYVLHGGIFNIGWTAANVKGYSSLANLKVDVPVANM